MIAIRRLWRGVFNVATILAVGILWAHAWWHYRRGFREYTVEEYNECMTHLS